MSIDKHRRPVGDGFLIENNNNNDAFKEHNRTAYGRWLFISFPFSDSSYTIRREHKTKG